MIWEIAFYVTIAAAMFAAFTGHFNSAVCFLIASVIAGHPIPGDEK